MSETFTAVVEGRMLRPTVPLLLKEGSQVNVLIFAAPPATGAAAAQIISAVASIPEDPGPQFTNREHDQILYCRADQQ
jgi:hypothetical protein